MVIFLEWKRKVLPTLLFQLIPRMEQGWDEEQMCLFWGNSIARADAILCGFVGLSWPSFLHLELAPHYTVRGPPAGPSGNWIRAICAKSFTICYQVITLVVCCQAWTCSFVSISCTYWLDLLCSVGEDVLWLAGRSFVSCGERLVYVAELVRRCLMEMRLGSVYWRKKKLWLCGSERGKATGIRNKPVVSLRGRGNGLSRLAALCLEEVYTK